MPDVHPHAPTGAMVSLAVMWRLPLLQARDSDESLPILTLLAQQARRTGQPVLKRYGSKPKRLTSRRLHILQGFPGVGPALAQRLLARFGSVEGVVTAEETALTDVRGFGPKKAMRLRETAREGQSELARASAITTAADESHSFGPENSGK